MSRLLGVNQALPQMRQAIGFCHSFLQPHLKCSTINVYIVIASTLLITLLARL